jgi:Rieske Fe-S protein
MDEDLSRRRFAKIAFFGSLGVLGVAGIATALNLLHRRDASGSEVVISRDRVPAAGERPLYVAEGRFLLVNLRPNEGLGERHRGSSAGGLLALSVRCPHLACAVEAPEPNSETGRRLPAGVEIVCRCHWSTFTRAGVRVFGPSPRSLDTIALRVSSSGNVIIDPPRVSEGGVDNPIRAVPYNARHVIVAAS